MRVLTIAALAGLWPTGAFAQTIELNYDPDRFENPDAVIEYIAAAAMGGDVEIVSLNISDGIAVVQAAENAGRLFRSDPVFLTVREEAGPSLDGRRFWVAMDADNPIAQAGRDVHFRAATRTGWAGERLRVVAYDRAGQIIGETFVPDPRFVRFEAWADDGQHIAGSNRSFIQDAPLPPILVDLPAQAVEIAVFDQTGTHIYPRAGRLVGRVRDGFIREAE